MSLDLGFLPAATTVSNILQYWEYEDQPDAVLKYDAFATPALRTAVDCIELLKTTSRQLTDYTIDTDKDRLIAVVGERQLTKLERSILLPSPRRSDLDFMHDGLDPPAENDNVIDNVSGGAPRLTMKAVKHCSWSDSDKH